VAPAIYFSFLPPAGPISNFTLMASTHHLQSLVHSGKHPISTDFPLKLNIFLARGEYKKFSLKNGTLLQVTLKKWSGKAYNT
jgi:hypothetical protein